MVAKDSALAVAPNKVKLMLNQTKILHADAEYTTICAQTLNRHAHLGRLLCVKLSAG